MNGHWISADVASTMLPTLASGVRGFWEDPMAEPPNATLIRRR